MITQEPTKDMLEEWKSIWIHYKERLRPNRKSGTELLHYLQEKYVLTEIHDKSASDAVIGNVNENECYAEKLPAGTAPVPRTFFLENTENGKVLYQDQNKDSVNIWGGDIARIFVGIDTVTGFFMVEGSTMLWDELYAFRGLDKKDLQNYVCVAEYINSLKRFDLLTTVIPS
ncbi:hypothetical protein [Lacrimispora sp.]|uniref:hypothetical protein n=1 Tax=Lacrimispora sp. TaxID=2719234 RepID=UPI00289E1972|nr:hypothetical protein [Lacrimispora sp.]